MYKALVAEASFLFHLLAFEVKPMYQYILPLDKMLESHGKVETKETGFWSKVGACLSTVLKNPEAMKSLALVIPTPYDVMVVLGLQIVGALMGVDEKDGAKLGYQMNKADKAFDDPEFGGSFEKYKEYLDKDFCPMSAPAYSRISEK